MKDYITGTWIELHHNGLAEGKYFNKITHEYDDNKWEALVDDMASLNMKYLVLMQTAICEADGVVYTAYNSKYYPKSKMIKANNPIEAILNAADRNNMKVFVSTGYYNYWMQVYLNMTDKNRIKKQQDAMKEIYELYGHHKSFYGYYLPDESEINDYFDEYFIEYCNIMNKFTKALNSNLKILIAPYGTCKLHADDKYVEQLKRLDVDFVAYQDEVGVRKTLPKYTANFYKNLKKCHDKANKSKLWADMETFEFEKNRYQSALLPAKLERINRQINSIKDYVDELLIFEYQCSFSKPGSKASIKSKKAEDLYIEYKNKYINKK